MNLIRRCLGRARISNSNRQVRGDDDHNNKSLDHISDCEQSDSYNLEDKDPIDDCMVKMLNLIRELAILCVVFMAYAAITNDPPKISKAPAAYPFFPKNALVKDFYRGQIIAAVEYARTTDISFIMFYAPWDAESQAARKEFLLTANHMKDHINFVAVNCWQPGSDCRNQYNKVYRWPVLIVYPSFGSGIQYNGPISAPHMISFLQKVMRPVRRVNETILNFEEAFVVAELNTLPRSIEYSVYYTTALKYMEGDYAARVSFYVKPMTVTKNKISLYLWDQVKILDIEPGDWKAHKILQWIMKTVQLPSTWVAPTGSKSLLLSELSGPSLLLFTPKNPLQTATDYYMMLQEIAYEYKNCDNWALNFDMKTKRLSHFLEHKRLKNTCYMKHTSHKAKKIASVTTVAPFHNSSSGTHHIKAEKIELDCNILGLNIKTSDLCQNSRLGECFEIAPRLPIISGEDKSSDSNAIDQDSSEAYYVTSMWRQDSDPKSMQNLRTVIRKQKCKNFVAAEQIHPADFELNGSLNSDYVDVTGLSCLNANHSLNFIAMDSLMNYMFAEKLGINLFQKKDKSAIVIIDQKMETHYIMEGQITSKNIRLFIRNFTNNTLSRSFNSSVNAPSKNSPSFTFNRSIDSDVPSIHVEELSSKNFLETALQPKKAVLVLYYSKQCTHCNGISYIYLTVARKLSFVDNIKFTVINGEENILPWEYTMEYFPTLLFFPSNRKEETRVFPSNIPITVPNLLGFILANVNKPMKIHVMYSICLHTQKERASCLTTVRYEMISLIEKTLKEWRKANHRQRRLILHNLKQLRQLQFLFSHFPDEYSMVESYFKKLRVHSSDDYNTSTNSTNVLRDEL